MMTSSDHRHRRTESELEGGEGRVPHRAAGPCGSRRPARRPAAAPRGCGTCRAPGRSPRPRSPVPSRAGRRGGTAARRSHRRRRPTAISELGTRSSPASRITCVMPVPRQISPTVTPTSEPNGPTSPSRNQSTANPVVTASRHTTADTTASSANGTSTRTRVTGHSTVRRRSDAGEGQPDQQLQHHDDQDDDQRRRRPRATTCGWPAMLGVVVEARRTSGRRDWSASRTTATAMPRDRSATPSRPAAPRLPARASASPSRAAPRRSRRWTAFCERSSVVSCAKSAQRPPRVVDRRLDHLPVRRHGHRRAGLHGGPGDARPCG